MANGFFLGGMAEGMQQSRETGLKERAQEQDVGLRKRALDIQEKQFGRAAAQDDIKRGDELIAQTMGHVSEVIKSGLAVGTDPAKLQQAVVPLVNSAKAIAQRVGRDPASLDAQVQATLTQPTGLTAASAAGTAAGTQKATSDIAEEATLKAAGTEGGLGKWKTLDEKVKAEGALRDDYLKQSKEFTTVRDYKDRMDNAPKTGAGDIALIFSFMKVLDPGSTVREGEFATAANAAGVPNSILGMYNKLIGGGKLAEGAREEISGTADKIWQKAAERQSSLTNRFADIAKRQKMDIRNVIVDPASGSPMGGTTPGGLKWTILP